MNKLNELVYATFSEDISNVWKSTDFQKKLKKTIKEKDGGNTQYLLGEHAKAELEKIVDMDINTSDKMQKIVKFLKMKDMPKQAIEKVIETDNVTVDKVSEILKLLDLNRENTQVKKKPHTPYIKFCMKERSDMKNMYPYLSAKEITSKLGERWNRYKIEQPQYLVENYDYVPKQTT